MSHVHWLNLREYKIEIQQQQQDKGFLQQPKDDIRQSLFVIPIKRKRKRSDGTDED